MKSLRVGSMEDKIYSNLSIITKRPASQTLPVDFYTVSVLGREEGYAVKYTPSPEGVSDGKAQGNS